MTREDRRNAVEMEFFAHTGRTGHDRLPFKGEVPDPVDALFRRIISPGKADGLCLLVDELTTVEWVILRSLIGRGEVEIIEGGFVTASLPTSALIRLGYLTIGISADDMEDAERDAA